MTEIVSPFKEAVEAITEAGGQTFNLCYQCGLCNTVCPWNIVRTFFLRRMIRQAQFGLSEIESEEIWLCTTCLNCVQRCPRGVEITDLVRSLRRIASDWGILPKGIRSVRASLGAEGNPWGEKRQKRADWAKGLSVPTFTSGTEILYFPGCVPSYDPRVRKVAASTVNILKKAGVDFGILGSKESCCGESIRKLGEEDLFQTLAKQNIETFIENGVKAILVSSPHCYHTFKREYPEFNGNFDVIHISEYLPKLIDEGRLRFAKEYGKKVTYHDPCYLGRHNGIYDEPRKTLRSIPRLELVEMADCLENSLCCGGGGGRIWMDTPKGERFSDLRLRQAIGTGATVLATFCPYCMLNFEASRLSLEDSEGEVIEIKDVTEIIQEVL